MTDNPGREYARQQHRRLAMFSLLQGIANSWSIAILSRAVLEQSLGLETLRESRIDWVVEDLSEVFPGVYPFRADLLRTGYPSPGNQGGVAFRGGTDSFQGLFVKLHGKAEVEEDELKKGGMGFINPSKSVAGNPPGEGSNSGDVPLEHLIASKLALLAHGMTSLGTLQTAPAIRSSEGQPQQGLEVDDNT